MAVEAMINPYTDMFDEWGYLRNGYYVMIFVDENDDPAPYFVHEVNAENNIPNPDPNKFKYVIHKNGNYMDNRIENLEWSEKPETMMFEYLSDEALMQGGAFDGCCEDYINDVKSCYNCKHIHTQDPEGSLFHCDLHDKNVEYVFCCPCYNGDKKRKNIMSDEYWNHGKFWHARQLWEADKLIKA